IFVGDIDRNLVGHWMFEENAADSSDHGNAGIITGNPEFVQGNSGEGAIKFNDKNDYVAISESPDFSMTSFTLTAWVKIPNSIPSGWRTIVEHNRWGRNWFGLWKSANGNRFHFRWGNAGNSTADFNATISSDRWYHVAATFNSNQKTARLYLNGNLDKVINNADAPASLLAELRIGINMDGNEEFRGIIDDLRIYNVPLEASEIENIIAFTGVKYNQSDTEIPEKYALSNYPNPFNPSTNIHYYLPVESHVMITIHNVNGRVIETLVNQRKQAGYHSCEFHGDNHASGIYFYQLKTEKFKISKKMLYLK
ncbi:T9SS type A sorting domain-containing protein, partial [candidate division KSB1 bacterium]|nr:T9SS type A sorting domain-containing protein [candidate division KSB1 bacterium]